MKYMYIIAKISEYSHDRHTETPFATPSKIYYTIISQTHDDNMNNEPIFFLFVIFCARHIYFVQQRFQATRKLAHRKFST